MTDVCSFLFLLLIIVICHARRQPDPTARINFAKLRRKDPILWFDEVTDSTRCLPYASHSRMHLSLPLVTLAGSSPLFELTPNSTTCIFRPMFCCPIFIFFSCA